MIPPPPCQERASYYVYLLRSLKTKRFYLGWTTNLKRRLDEHNMGKSFYTKSRGPWELITYEIHPTIESAKKREHTLKRSSRMLYFFRKRALASLRHRSLLAAVKEVAG